MKKGDILSLTKITKEIKLLATSRFEITSVGQDKFKFIGEASGVRVTKMKVKDLDVKITVLTAQISKLTTTVNDRFDMVDERLESIENTPTIKKELVESK